MITFAEVFIVMKILLRNHASWLHFVAGLIFPCLWAFLPASCYTPSDIEPKKAQPSQSGMPPAADAQIYSSEFYIQEFSA